MKITIEEEIDINQLSLADLKSMPVNTLADIIYAIANTPEPVPSQPLQQYKKRNVKYTYGYKPKDASSQFHYVSWISQKKEWVVQIMGNTIGYFDDEIIAAIAADKYLDSIGDTDRPRNRSKFQEVSL